MAAPTQRPSARRDALAALHAWLDAVLYGFSTLAVPIVLALLSVVALVYWDDFYAAPGARELGFRAVSATGQEALTPRQAADQLRDLPPILHLDNRLATTPFWVAVPIPAGDRSSDVVDFPSRHSRELTCWNGTTFEWLGHATRDATAGVLVPGKAGYVIDLGRIGPVTELLCRVTFIGPARMTVLQWPAGGFAASSQAFHRNAGLLEGGLIVLALFVLMTALINRNRVYILFATWLIVNLRMGSLSAGWDFHWLGGAIPEDLQPRGRLLTLAVYYALTITLFRTLFRDDLRQVGHVGLVRIAQWTCLPVLAGSLILPYPQFLLFLWVMTGVNAGVVIYLLARILSRLRSRVAMWYSASLFVMLFATLYEVVSAAFGLRGMIGAVNNVTGALASSLLASLAIAEQMRLDVIEKSRATEELRFMANSDSLTKVLNRRGIEKVLEAMLADSADGRPLALAYLDLDRFKLINDLFGHDAGDAVLRQVCLRVTAMLPQGVVMGRVGGDEFLIVMPDTRISEATMSCRRILLAIGGTSYRVADQAFHVRGSIGLIEVAPGTQIRDAVSTADRACRDAKDGHSDGLVIYEKSACALREHEAERRLAEHLSGSAATEGLFLVMQPILSLTAPRASLDFEVLLRMRDKEGRLVPTSSLIAAAEHSGRMGIIDRWVLSAALAWLRRHAAQLRNTRFVCLNLSGASLNDEQFLQDVDAMLAQNTDLAGLLCFEITESVALHDLENTRRFIDRVRGYGARVALDDFGAGYTSFSYLKELPADLLKIDGSFVVNMNRHAADAAIVEAVMNLGRQLGMKIVAEWAEDLDTVRRLAELGVDYVQGYAIARPQAPEALLAAASSASFIQDEETARYVRRLGGVDDTASRRARPAARPDLVS